MVNATSSGPGQGLGGSGLRRQQGQRSAGNRFSGGLCPAGAGHFPILLSGEEAARAVAGQPQQGAGRDLGLPIRCKSCKMLFRGHHHRLKVRERAGFQASGTLWGWGEPWNLRSGKASQSCRGGCVCSPGGWPGWIGLCGLCPTSHSPEGRGWGVGTILGSQEHLTGWGASNLRSQVAQMAAPRLSSAKQRT